MRIHSIMFDDADWNIIVEIAKRKGTQAGTLIRMHSLEHLVEPERKRKKEASS